MRLMDEPARVKDTFDHRQENWGGGGHGTSGKETDNNGNEKTKISSDVATVLPSY